MQFWQKSVRHCTDTARLRDPNLPPGRWWQDFTDPTQKGPSLGPLLQCVAARLAAAGRHHKGLLAFFRQHPLPDRYPPSCLRWGTATRGYLPPTSAMPESWQGGGQSCCSYDFPALP